jgi:hypothetical protein
MTTVNKHTQNMPVKPTYTRFCTEGPPGSREGFGDVVPPSRQCPPATSSEREFSRRQGDLGPSPDYPMHGPFCDSSAELATTMTCEGQHQGAYESSNMFPLDHDSPWLAPTSVESRKPKRDSIGHIADGTHTQFSRIAGDVEGKQNSRSYDLNETVNINIHPWIQITYVTRI